MTKWDRADKRPPTLAEQRVAAPDAPPHRSRKNTRKWCRGKVGVEHVPGVRLSQTGRWAKSRGEVICHWEDCDHWSFVVMTGLRNKTGQFWRCLHEDYCATCGKTLSAGFNGVDSDRCPDYPHSPATSG